MTMRINKLKLREMIDYVLIYLLIFFSNGYQLSVYTGTIRLLMNLGLVILLVFYSSIRRKSIKTNQLSLIILITILCNIVLTFMVNNEGLNQILITVALFLTAFIFTVFYNINDFLKKFIKIMSFLCVYSLVLYFATILLPDMVKHLPIVQNVQGKLAYNAFFSTIRLDSYLIRNQGIFWEPGAFQTFINLALIFNLFIFKENQRKNLVIFGMALFTTFSTTGYIVGLIIIFVFVLHSQKKEERKKLKRTYGVLLIVVVLLLTSLIVYNSLPENARYQTFGKVGNYLKDGNYSSTSVRIDAIVTPLKQFVNKPIFGNGTLGLKEVAIASGYNMNTCTVVNWFAMFGIFVGLSMNYGLFRLSRIFKSGKVIKLLLFAAMLLTLFSEDYVRNPSILVFVFYGYHNLKRINTSIHRKNKGEFKYENTAN
jgi:hypothetical protein